MCTSPHRVFKTGLHTDSGKDLLFFDSHYPAPPAVSVTSAERQLKRRIPFDPHYMSVVDGEIFLDCFVDVPCVKCDECRLSHAREWSHRCMMEMEHTDGPCWFLTLTFDEIHCPQKVDKKDVSMFIKRLRKRLDRPGIRFFAAGEYGEKSGRPHYHMILFGCPLDDLYLVDASQGLRGSRLIDDIWPFGMHVLADVTQESINYVARYTSKKTDARKGFILMSRRPGIGRDFLAGDAGYFDLGYIPLAKDGRLIRAPLPRYFEKLWPDLPWNKRKAQRLDVAYSRRYLEMAVHGLSPYHLDEYKRAVNSTLARRLEKKSL